MAGPSDFPDLRYLGVDHILTNVPPIMNVNGAVFDDIDGDGDRDFLFSAVNDGAPLMYRNDTDLGHRFCVRGHGTLSNALGVGSFVEVETADGHVQRVSPGSSVRVLLCDFDTAPVSFGEQPQRVQGTPNLQVSTRVVSGASTFNGAPGPYPAGCIERSAFSTRTGQTLYTLTVQGRELRTQPRIWWED